MSPEKPVVAMQTLCQPFVPPIIIARTHIPFKSHASIPAPLFSSDTLPQTHFAKRNLFTHALASPSAALHARPSVFPNGCSLQITEQNTKPVDESESQKTVPSISAPRGKSPTLSLLPCIHLRSQTNAGTESVDIKPTLTHETSNVVADGSISISRTPSRLERTKAKAPPASCSGKVKTRIPIRSTVSATSTLRQQLFSNPFKTTTPPVPSSFLPLTSRLKRPMTVQYQSCNHE